MPSGVSHHPTSPGTHTHNVQVFVDAPLEVVAERDPKGLYKKAIAGEIKGACGPNTRASQRAASNELQRMNCTEKETRNTRWAMDGRWASSARPPEFIVIQTASQSEFVVSMGSFECGGARGVDAHRLHRRLVAVRGAGGAGDPHQDAREHCRAVGAGQPSAWRL